MAPMLLCLMNVTGFHTLTYQLNTYYMLAQSWAQGDYKDETGEINWGSPLTQWSLEEIKG